MMYSRAWGSTSIGYRLSSDGITAGLDIRKIKRKNGRIIDTPWITISSEPLDDIIGMPTILNVDIPAHCWADLITEIKKHEK
jgi:hypothetical protein